VDGARDTADQGCSACCEGWEEEAATEAKAVQGRGEGEADMLAVESRTDEGRGDASVILPVATLIEFDGLEPAAAAAATGSSNIGR